MARYIDADSAIINFGFEWSDICPTRDEVVAFIRKQSTADVVPVRRGEWLKTRLESGWVECVCSICGGDAPAEYGRYTWIKSDYCPDCGARMEGEK